MAQGREREVSNNKELVCLPKKKSESVVPVEAPQTTTESIIEAEGAAHNEDVEKAKSKSANTVQYPLNAKVNPWGFIHFKKHWLADLGWTEDMAITIEKNADGSLTVRKA